MNPCYRRPLIAADDYVLDSGAAYGEVVARVRIPLRRRTKAALECAARTARLFAASDDTTDSLQEIMRLIEASTIICNPRVSDAAASLGPAMSRAYAALRKAGVS